MAEKKEPAKKPAAKKAPAKKPAATKPAAKKASTPAAAAPKNPLRPTETRTSGEFDPSGIELPGASAKGEVIARPSGANRSVKKRVTPAAGTLAQKIDKKDLQKKLDAARAEEEAKKAAERKRRGLPETIDAPAPRKFKTGRVAKASPVATGSVKKTSSARAAMRRAGEAAQAPQPEVEKTAKDYMREAPAYEKEIVPVWHSPAGDLLTRFSATPHIRAMKIVNALDAKIGYNGENLPSSIPEETRQEISGRMASVRNSHHAAYKAAISGDPVASIQRAFEAHETLQSIGEILSRSPEANKTRALSVARDIISPIKQHGDIVKRALYDQKKNMSIDTTDPQWKIADSVMGLANERALIPSGPNAGGRRTKDFKTPDSRNIRRGHAVFPVVKTLITTALAHSQDPRDQLHAQKLALATRGFGEAVASGEMDAARNLGNQALQHLTALHNSVRNQLKVRYPSGDLGNRVASMYSSNLAKHHDTAAFRINEILGEK